jgi:phosphoribosylamine--glycine ligase
MKVLIVGGGGREHALARALAQYGHSLAFTTENPVFSTLGDVVPGDPAAVAARLAERGALDLVVVGPEAPLADGLVDALSARGIAAFGPTAVAARLETSKVFAKRFCERHGIPVARSRIVHGPDEVAGAWVVKLDGLAAGKGVWVCTSEAETRAAVTRAVAMRPGAPVLLEERLEGPEVSVLALSDGARVASLPPARDHKRRHDGDEGSNTGGMGAVAPAALAPDVHAQCVDVLARAVRGMAAEGTPFRGVLYGGFMLTADGPRLLEFNVRFGDPECQVILPLIDEDLAAWLLGAARGALPPGAPRVREAHACCVVVVGEGYPERAVDAPIEALPADAVDLMVFHAGTRRDGDGPLRACGGRILGVTGLGPTAAAARMRAYHGVREVRFAGADWRTDIGAA